MAITKFKSLSTYYKFVALLIYKKKAKALRVLPSRKSSKGVFYSSAGSGATVGYRY